MSNPAKRFSSRALLSALILALAALPHRARGEVRLTPPPISLDAPMGEALARDMLGRFGFGATQADIERVARLTPGAYLEQGIRGTTVLPPHIAAQIAAMPAAGPLVTTWTNYGPGGQMRVGLENDAQRRREINLYERVLLRGAVEARIC